LIPAHASGSSEAWFSDDGGLTWQRSESVGMGNESEIAEISGGGLLMVVRPNHPVSQPHGELQALFSSSSDGGLTWSGAVEHPDLRTSICMASLVSGSTGELFYSYPDDYFSRARMTVARSDDGGTTFPHRLLIFPGPSGYSDLGVLSGGDLLLLFENGTVEYDQRLTLVRINP
jgi:sialidase-1